MPDTPLHDLVLKRLEAATDDGNDWYPLVMAALEGRDELAQLLDEGNALSPEPLRPPPCHPEPLRL